MSDIDHIGTGMVIGGIALAGISLLLWAAVGVSGAVVMLTPGALIACSGAIVKAISAAVYEITMPDDAEEEDEVEA